MSISPNDRLRELQVACPLELAIIATADWPHEYEAKIHYHLRHSAIRGEWFEATFRSQQIVGLMAEPEGLRKLDELLDRKPPKAEPKVVQIDPAKKRKAQREAWWEAKRTA